MGRIRNRILSVASLFVAQWAVSARAADWPLQVEEGQVRGIHCALKDENRDVRSYAARKLAELLETDEETGEPIRIWPTQVRQRAIATVPDLLEMTRHVGPDGVQERGSAVMALGRLGDKQVATRLRELLNDDHVYVRGEAVDAIGRLGVANAVPDLMALLDDQRSLSIEESIVEALARLHARQAVPRLKALSDQYPPVPGLAGALRRLEEAPGDQAAAQPKGDLRAYEIYSLSGRELRRRNTRVNQAALMQTVPDLMKTLHDQTTRPGNTQLAVEALGDLGIKAAVPDLLNLASYNDEGVRRAAAEALGDLQAAGAIPDLLDILKDRRSSKEAREFASRALDCIRPSSISLYLDLAYEGRVEGTSAVVAGRWWAHYWGAGDKAVEIQCAYLSLPAAQPALPKDRVAALAVLDALGAAWDTSGSPWLHEDAAAWVCYLITDQAGNWKAEDAPQLRQHLNRLKQDTHLNRGPLYAASIEATISTLETYPPPWVRTLIAVIVVNLIAVFIFAFRPARHGLDRWLPFFGYAGAGAASWLAGTVGTFHLQPWLLGGLLVAELFLLIAAGVFSPAVLRQIARIEPLNRVAVPLTLRLPRSRRRLFRDYVLAVRRQLERDRRQANDESYTPLPARVRSDAKPEGAPAATPATDILRHLSGDPTVRGHVLVEGAGGRGKSALLREVVRLALDQFETNPAGKPLPVLLAGADGIDKLVAAAVGSSLLGLEFLAMHLEAGDFMLVMDGASESGISANVLDGFIHGPYGRTTPLFLGSRPNRTYRHVIEGSARWMIVEPCRLDELTVDRFVTHYGGAVLPPAARAACRGADGTYLPVLVRMAMTVGAGTAVAETPADIYRRYFLKLFEAQFSDEAERFGRLEDAARWCLETYWVDGLRRRAYLGSPLQQQLRTAGVLIPADNSEPPSEVMFFHDSMQSYLTARGLAAQDQNGYAGLPRPKDGAGGVKTWNRGRVLLWSAANPRFARARSDLLRTGGSELFQMCLATFTPRAGLRQWLRDELVAWADRHGEDLRRRDVLAGLPSDAPEHVKKARGAADLLERAARDAFDADEKRNGLEGLGTLYAGIAPLVYELTDGAEAEAADASTIETDAVAV